ncbi:FAD:protein FMN transferase [Nocardia miyunensis]|uniref:FAD:protein FMN transferase n=1 Tax=Nocardia miyunensis TaxID=282684 RepID=UPI000AEC2B2B|nr:FAD:protein FMN transferase [Nocardia miyunensis]
MSGSRAAVSASTTLSAIGTTVVIVCTDARELAFATRLVRTRLDELDRAASRFRRDSELWQINARSAESARTGGCARLRIPVGWTLGSCLRAAMRVEHSTEGLVCASLGAMLAACGYDDDLDAVREILDRAGGLTVPARRCGSAADFCPPPMPRTRSGRERLWRGTGFAPRSGRCASSRRESTRGTTCSRFWPTPPESRPGSAGPACSGCQRCWRICEMSCGTARPSARPIVSPADSAR